MSISKREAEDIVNWINRNADVPNLTNGKFIDGELYCWDRNKKSFFHVELSPVNDVSLLNTLAAALIDDKCKKTGEEKAGDNL